MRNIIPSTEHCTKVLDSENDLAKIANGACIEEQVFWEGKKETLLFVKRAKGTEITPYAQGSIFLILPPENIVIKYQISPMIHISSDDVFKGQWHPWYQANPDDLISGTGLTRKGDQLLLPKSNHPVLEWNGSFYVALVDFYEPMERYDLSKD